MNKFESKVCSRCGGSGHYSFNLMHGTTCYGCSGTGVQYTKRGKEALRFFEESMKVEVKDLKPGNAIKFFTLDRKFKKIGIIEVGGEKYIGEKYRTAYYGSTPDAQVIFIEAEDKSVSITRMKSNDKIRIFHTSEEKAEKLKLALEYQETLTAQGKVKKNKK